MGHDVLSRVTPPLVLDVMELPLSIVQLPADSAAPSWLDTGRWYSVTRTMDECSIICASQSVPAEVPQVGPWRGLAVAGPLAFDLVGVLSRLAAPLAEAGISIFVVSTYNTDYVLVREQALNDAIIRLQQAGIVVRPAD